MASRSRAIPADTEYLRHCCRGELYESRIDTRRSRRAATCRSARADQKTVERPLQTKPSLRTPRPLKGSPDGLTVRASRANHRSYMHVRTRRVATPYNKYRSIELARVPGLGPERRRVPAELRFSGEYRYASRCGIRSAVAHRAFS